MHSKSRNSTLLLNCLLLSAVLHAAFIGVFGVYITYFLPKLEKATAEKKHFSQEVSSETMKMIISQVPALQSALASLPKSLEEVPQDIIDQLSEKELEKLEEKIEEEKPNLFMQFPSQRFERTSTEQESQELVPETSLYGVRNTIAQSDTAVDPSAINRPAVDGVQDETKKDIIDSRFQEGNIAHEGGASGSESAGQLDGNEFSKTLEPDITEAHNDLKSVKTSNDVQKQAEATPQKSQQTQKTVLRNDPAAVTKLTEPDSEKDHVASKENNLKKTVKENHEPSDSEFKKLEVEAVAGGNKPKKGTVDQSKDPFSKALGMKSEVKKTSISGSLSRQGSTASRNVKATDLGKYQDAIMRAVELEWQMRCRENAGLLLPGQLTMRFYVSSNGKVTDIVPIDENAGGQRQKGVTLLAIRKATIPTMPSKLKSSQQGVPVEVVITFNF